MNSLSSSTGVIDPASAPATETGLRLSCTDTSTEDLAAESASVFSSIKQTAVALVTVASDQADKRARRTPRGQALRDAVNEHLELAVQRATAEQARRAADCLHTAFWALIDHIGQPCMAMDASGSITKWNPAMVAWTGFAAEVVVGRPLSLLLSAESAAIVEDSSSAVREAQEASGSIDPDPVFVVDADFNFLNGASARRVSLVPLCRNPRIVEAIVVLFTPLEFS